MSAARRTGQILGVVVGLALAATAIYSVFFIDWSRPPKEPQAVVRPLRVHTVGDRGQLVRTLPARVRATTEVTLSFQVPGVVQELAVVRGQHVARGDLLAQLDQRDFQSRLNAAQVQLAQLETELGAVTRAYQNGAATTIEVARFRSSVDRARTDVELADKALEDTTVRAPFDGVVADVFIDRFQKVGVGLPILRMQGRASVRVEVNVDPARVALSPRTSMDATFAVRFDFLPEQEFEAQLVEFTSEADPRTQTFLAIFELTAPEDTLILPGMPATLVERRPGPPTDDPGSLSVPLEALGFDGTGAGFVWVVKDGSGGEATVHRTNVDVGETLDDTIVITRGVNAGTRIARAGVQELTDGQRVRPVDDSGPATMERPGGR